MANILNKDLSQEEEVVLKEHIDSWKEGVYSDLVKEMEEKKEAMIQELDEANESYRQQLKEEFADKLVKAISEMRDDIVTEVTADLVSSNPDLKILESIKELVAPTLNEEYSSKLYADEVKALSEKVKELEEEKALDEGAKALADLVSEYPANMQNLIISLVSPGDADSITEQFYSIAKSLKEADEGAEGAEGAEGEEGSEKDGKKPEKKDGEKDGKLAGLEAALKLVGDNQEAADLIQAEIDKIKGEKKGKDSAEKPAQDPAEGLDMAGKLDGLGEGFESELDTYIKENVTKVASKAAPKNNSVLDEIRILANGK